ncbi:MAG: DUF4162 domain-containing protein, partial [Actinomycetota bacterium]|nr:DUF4162 domain-containing protein [Actinomycetota bacterium]
LEEADALADRVGIIDQGRIVQEGTPADLKRTVGADVIVVELGENLERAAAAANDLPAVDEVTTGPQGLTISTADGPGLVADVAVAFSRQGISPRSLTVRTPSLDDVFLRATGHRLSHEIDE